MNSIRKLVLLGIASTAAAAVVAFALAPATVLAEWGPRPLPKGTHTQTFEVAAPAPSAACIAAKQAIVSARVADRSEDMDKTASATDATEDQAERAALKPLLTTLIGACAPQAAVTKPTSPISTSSACGSAETALKNALIAERAHEATEASSSTERTSADWQEDQADFANLKSLWSAATTACGFSFERR